MIIKVSFLFAAAGGGLAVLLGAFGAHGLRGRIEDRLLDSFQTGLEYQMYHCLALLVVGILMRESGISLSLEIASYAFMLGILLFSGSIYGLVFTNMKWLGLVTPFGGLSFVVGWCALLYNFLRSVDR